MTNYFDKYDDQPAPETDAQGNYFDKYDSKAAPGRRPKHKDYEGWGEYLTDLGRSAVGQGALLGFGDEILAAGRSAFSDQTYEDALRDERRAVDRFRTKNPVAATTGELAGGLLTPGLGAAGFVGRGANLIGKMGRGSAVGGAFGGVNAIGGVEGNDIDSYLSAVPTGVATGMVVGAAVPAAIAGVQRGIRGADSTLKRAADNEAAARLYFADKLRDKGLTEQQVIDDLARGQAATQFSKGTASLPETIADTSPAAQRTLRGIKVGGEADEVIEPFLSKRQMGVIDFAKDAESGSQATRLGKDLQYALGVSQGDLADDVAALEGRRSASANKLFAKARAESQEFDLRPTLQKYVMQAMNLPDPKQRSVLLDAVKLFDPEGYTGGNILATAARKLEVMDERIANMQMRVAEASEKTRPRLQMNLEKLMARRATMAEEMPAMIEQQFSAAGNRIRFGTNNVDRFQKAKEALDDKIASDGVRDQGYLRKLLTNMKHDLLDGVFMPDDKGLPTINATYRKALDDFATKSELLNAAELGKRFANGTEDITPTMWKNMSEPEKRMVRKAWQERTEQSMKGKPAGPTTDFTGELRKETVADDLRLILPPTAGATKAGTPANVAFPGGNREKLAELVRREGRMSSTANRVLGNSSTAEKAADALDVGRLQQVTRYVRDQGGITQALLSGLSDAFERMSAIKGEKAKYLARQLLETDPAQQAAFLRAVEVEYGQNTARQIGSAINAWTAGIAASTSGLPARRSAENTSRRNANRRP